MSESILLSQIFENKAALRSVNRQTEDFQELVQSVRSKGILSPILVRRNVGDNRDLYPYILIDGLHRFTAASEAGLTEIPAHVKDMTDAQALEAQIVANEHRIETKPVEFSNGLKRLLAINPLMSMSELATNLGKSPTWLSQRLKLTDLDPAIGKLVDDNKIPLSNAYALARLPAAEQVKHTDQAMTMQPNEFLPHTQKIKAEIDKANREGRTAKTDEFVHTPHMRKMSEVKTEMESPSAAAKLVELVDISGTSKIEVFEAGFKAAIDWVMHNDPISVAEGFAQYEQRKAEMAKKKEDAAKEREEKKLNKAKVEADRVNLEFDLRQNQGKGSEEIAAALAEYDAKHGLNQSK